MWKPAKQLIQRTLSLFGIGIYRLPRLEGVVFHSAVEYNASREAGERFYSNPKYWKDYLENRGYQYYEAMLYLLKEKGIDCNGKRVADIGCGTGHLLLNIRENYGPSSMTGIDIVDSALEIAKSTVPDADIYNCDLLNPNGIGKFDVVFCAEVLEHIVPAEQALGNVINMINRPGVAIVTVPNGRLDRFDGHIHFWSPESWEIFVKNVCKDCDIETGLWLERKKNFAIIRPI